MEYPQSSVIKSAGLWQLEMGDAVGTFMQGVGILALVVGLFMSLAAQPIIGVLLICFGILFFDIGGIIDAISFAVKRIEARLPAS
jgi:hypothetical protein